MALGYVSVALFGALVGFSELVSRYKDRPSAVLLSGSAWFYILINGATSVGVFWAAILFGWDLGMTDQSQRLFVLVIVCGFGAMTLLRTSFANIKVNDREVPVGFIAVLEIFLEAANKGVDRARSAQRVRETTKIMKDISFEKAKEALPTAVLSAMQNVSAIEAEDLRKNINALVEANQPDSTKAKSLGMMLMNLTGPKSLTEAVNSLRDEIEVAAD